MREDLGAVYPSDALPRSTVDEAIQVHAHHGEVACARALDIASLGGGCGIVEEDVAADVPHWQRSDEGTVDETIATTELLDEVE